jgi:hypothetical protein
MSYRILFTNFQELVFHTDDKYSTIELPVSQTKEHTILDWNVTLEYT